MGQGPVPHTSPRSPIVAMHFGSPNQQKFFYGKVGVDPVKQEKFWKQATKREWKINGAKEQGYAEEIDRKKIDQMRSFLHHRGASRGSSHLLGEQQYEPQEFSERPLSRESRASRQTGLTSFTRATGWKSNMSTESSALLKELLASNLALKQEFGSLKTEMLRTNNRLAQMEPALVSGRGSRLGTERTKTPMLPK